MPIYRHKSQCTKENVVLKLYNLKKKKQGTWSAVQYVSSRYRHCTIGQCDGCVKFEFNDILCMNKQF